MSEPLDISVIIATYNRSDMLRSALESVLAQETDGIRYEVIVVDNNSPDNTREVVESLIEGGAANLRYLFEGRQGVAYARNTAIAEAQAPILAFTDDDVRVAPDWIASIKSALDEHPEVDCVGGKVLPLWQQEPPSWLTWAHWSPLALTDYGDEIFYTNAQFQRCLVTANLSFRREVFERIGLFSPDCQRVKDGIGSTEDHELQVRLWRAGGQGMYDPRLVVSADVQPSRMVKAYHRRWHTGHGRFCAVMRLDELEVGTAHLFGVPAHLFRQALIDTASWLKRRLLRQEVEAFEVESKLRFFLGFYRERSREFRAEHKSNAFVEVAKFFKSLATKKGSRALAKDNARSGSRSMPAAATAQDSSQLESGR